MNYNSSRDKLLYTEYGRNIQDLVLHAKTIESKEERQNYVETIVGLIEQMFPLGKGVDEARLKLWKQVFTIADFELDIEPPEGINLVEEDNALKPKALSYSNTKTQFRHYGQHIKTMMNKVIALEDPELQREFLMVIGSYMKLAYRTWNREQHISDDIIKADMKKISGGKLEIPEDLSLEMLATSSTDLSDRQIAKQYGKSKKSNHKKRRKPRGKRR